MQLSPPKLIAPEQQFAACLTNGGRLCATRAILLVLYLSYTAKYAGTFLHHAKRCACIPHYPLTWNL